MQHILDQGPSGECVVRKVLDLIRANTCRRRTSSRSKTTLVTASNAWARRRCVGAVYIEWSTLCQKKISERYHFKRKYELKTKKTKEKEYMLSWGERYLWKSNIFQVTDTRCTTVTRQPKQIAARVQSHEEPCSRCSHRDIGIVEAETKSYSINMNN